jgi:hypothetical protein
MLRAVVPPVHAMQGVMAMRADEFIGRHELLALDIDRLHLVATSADGALPEARMRAVVSRELLELCSVLAGHFTGEEASLRAMSADNADAVDELHHEHGRILAQLRHLAEAADTLPIDVLKLRISDVLDAVGEHERSEVRRVSEADARR